MEGPIDLRNNITCCFVVCVYKGYRRTFFMYSEDGRELISFVGNIENYGNQTLAITLSSFYDNHRKRIIPTRLPYYSISQEELIRRNGGREIYGVY
jgi:hypothetical protein